MESQRFSEDNLLFGGRGFAAASFSRFGLVNALAQNATDYKALVCVFLFGGNDSNNMVIPYDTTGYNGYKSARGGLGSCAGIAAAHYSPKHRLPRCFPSAIHRDCSRCSTTSTWPCSRTSAR